MKKVHFFSIVFLYLLFPCFMKSQFVTLYNNNGIKEFRLNGTRFFARAVNYEVRITHNPNTQQNPAGGYYPQPVSGLSPFPAFTYQNVQQAYNQMRQDFQWLSSQGFNSIRLYGSLEFNKAGSVNAQGYSTTPPMFPLDKDGTPAVPTLLPASYDVIFDCFQTVLDAAAAEGIKVQLLTGAHAIRDRNFSDQYYVPYLKALADRFKNNTTLFSYDLINEGNLFDNENNYLKGPQVASRGEACSLVESWNTAIHQNDPNHLTTVSLENTDLFIDKWDPGFLPVDFMSYHLYPNIKNEPNAQQRAIERFKDNVKWLAEISPGAWMIGETGFVASITNPSFVHGSLAEQATFASETINATRDCGGAGYAWWNYQSHFGLKFGLREDDYSVKTALVNAFSSFAPNSFGNSCPPAYLPPNYDHSTLGVSGTVLDQDSIPIKNALIYYSNRHAFTDSQGQFVFYTDYDINNPLYNYGPYQEVSVIASKCSIHHSLQFNLGDANKIIILNRYNPQPLQNVNVTNQNFSGQTQVFEAMNITATNSNLLSPQNNISLEAFESIGITNFGVSPGNYFSCYFGSLACGEVGSSYNNRYSADDDSDELQGATTFAGMNSLPDGIAIFPNPTEESFNVSWSDKLEAPSSIVIQDVLGREIQTIRAPESGVKCDIKEFEKGIYIVKLNYSNKVYSKKLIKN